MTDTHSAVVKAVQKLVMLCVILCVFWEKVSVTYGNPRSLREGTEM